MWQKVKSFSLLLLSEGLMRIVSFVVIVIVARELGPQALGYWSYALAINAFLLIATNFGLDIYALVEVTKHPSKRSFVLSNVIAIKTLLLLLVASLLFIFQKSFDPKVFELLLTLLLSDFFASLAPIWFFQSRSDFVSISKFKTIQALGYASFITLFFMYRIDILFLALAYLFANLLAALLFFKRVWRYFRIKKIALKRWRAILSHGVYLGGALFMTQIYGNTDKVMIGSLLGKVEAGWYEAGYKLYALVLVLFSLIWTIYAPRLTKSIHKELIPFLIALSVPAFFASLLFFLMPSPLITSLYGEAFIPTIHLLWLFAISTLVMIPSYGFSSILSLIEKRRSWFYLTLLCATTNVALNFLLIPIFAIEGALWATIVAEGVMAIGSYLVLKRL